MVGDFFSAIGDVLSSETTYSSGWRLAVALAFVAVGEWIAERAGTINISVEGSMLAGAFAAAMGFDASGSVAVGLLIGAAAGLLVGAVQAHFSHNLTANQFVVGLTLNILVLGLASFLNSTLKPETATAHVFEVPGLVEIPLLGPALFGQPWPLYLLYPLVPLAWWLVHRTRWGLEVRAVGENPQAADVSSIDVNARRRQAIYFAGITSGLGGGYLLLGQVGWFEDNIVGGQGFIAIAAVIFGGWTLRGAMLGCLLFGSANSFRLSLPAVGHPLNSELLSSLPFVLTICVMALFAHRTRGPQSLARPFIRGLR